MGIPVYFDQDQDSPSQTGNDNITNTSPPTLPPRHPHRRLTHYYQHLRHNQHPHHPSPPPSSQLEHLVGFSFRSDQAPVRPPRQSSLARVDTITPRRGSERSSILFRYYQQQQQAHHQRQSQQQEDEEEGELNHVQVADLRSASVQATLFSSPPTSIPTSTTATLRTQPPSIPSRSRSRPPVTAAVTTSEPIVSSPTTTTTTTTSHVLSPLHDSPSMQPWDHEHQLSLYERSQQRRQQRTREQREQYEAQLDAHQQRVSTTPPTAAFSLHPTNTAPLSNTDSSHRQQNGSRHRNFSRTLATTRHGIPWVNIERTNKEEEGKKEVSLLENISMGPSPEATTGTANLTIDTSSSLLADRSNRTSPSSPPTVNRHSVLPSVPSTSTTVTTVTATSRTPTTLQECPSIIIVHFVGGGHGQGGSPRGHIPTTTSSSVTGRGGDEYRDAMQHHEQFRRAVQELMIPVREVCSLMPVLNAMCCIVEDLSGLWKLAQVPVVRHLWKGVS